MTKSSIKISAAGLENIKPMSTFLQCPQCKNISIDDVTCVKHKDDSFTFTGTCTECNKLIDLDIYKLKQANYILEVGRKVRVTANTSSLDNMVGQTGIIASLPLPDDECRKRFYLKMDRGGYYWSHNIEPVGDGREHA